MTRLRTIIITAILSLFAFQQGAIAQSNQARMHAGGFYYLGDLSPLSSIWSFSSYNPGLGLSYTFPIYDWLDAETKFSWGRLSGSDAEARSEDRRRRNLSFQSSLYELHLGVNALLNPVLSFLDKYELQLYYTTGVSLFHFNPKATYRGELIALQPLSTEGQGTIFNPNTDPYQLTQISIPFGLGVNFDLSSAVMMGIEIVPRWTFTDYIDDVSGTYVAYDDLLSTKGILSASLANRTGELSGTGIVDKPGKLRGDPNDNDWYFFAGIYMSYKWNSEPKEEEAAELKLTNDIKPNRK